MSVSVSLVLMPMSSRMCRPPKGTELTGSASAPSRSAKEVRRGRQDELLLSCHSNTMRSASQHAEDLALKK